MLHDESLEEQVEGELQVIHEVADMLADPQQRFSDEDRRGLAHLLRRTAHTIAALTAGRRPDTRAPRSRGTKPPPQPPAAERQTLPRPNSGPASAP